MNVAAIIPARYADVPIWRTSGYYRKEMKRNFPKQLYSHRNKSETVFFVAKRMMPEDVMSRKETTQDNEMLFRLIAYNAYRITKLGFCFGMVSTSNSSQNYKTIKYKPNFETYF